MPCWYLAWKLECEKPPGTQDPDKLGDVPFLALRRRHVLEHNQADNQIEAGGLQGRYTRGIKHREITVLDVRGELPRPVDHMRRYVDPKTVLEIHGQS